MDIHVKAFAHVSLNRRICFPSPEHGHILIFSRQVLPSLCDAFSELPGKMSPPPTHTLLDVPTATCLFNNNNYIDHNSNQDVLSPYHVLRQYSKHFSWIIPAFTALWLNDQLVCTSVPSPRPRLISGRGLPCLLCTPSS